MRLRLVSIALVFAVCTVVGSAQRGSDGSARASSAVIAPSKAADEMLSAFEEQLMGVVKEMPAEKYDFAPSAANFAPGQGARFAGARTFAQQVAHLTQANYYFYSTVSGLKPDVNVKAIGSMTKKDELVAALAASFAFAHRAVATITPANALVEIKGVDGIHTRLTVAAFAVAHGNDHYGQMVEYLRMNGMVPPGSK